jgi:hypothetical protein
MPAPAGRPRQVGALGGTMLWNGSGADASNRPVTLRPPPGALEAAEVRGIGPPGAQGGGPLGRARHGCPGEPAKPLQPADGLPARPKTAAVPARDLGPQDRSRARQHKPLWHNGFQAQKDPPSGWSSAEGPPQDAADYSDWIGKSDFLIVLLTRGTDDSQGQGADHAARGYS